MKEHIDEMTKVLVDYTKKNHIMASHVILEDYAEQLYNSGYRKQEWISVDERLPEESDWYLVNIITPFDLEFASISHYSQGYGWNNPDIITHWMPLPQPPKMKGGAE